MRDTINFSLGDKVALITGATGGIGQAIVRTFSSADARIFMTARNKDKLKDVSRSIKNRGKMSEYLAFDLNKECTADKLIASVLKQMGRIDILVNCAGINRPQKAESITLENWDDIMNINLKSLFLLSQAAGKEMIRTGGGKIINISSQAGKVALPMRVAYCSSKGGVDQLTRTLALEWAKHNITVNAVAPTFVMTPFTQEMFKDKTFEKYVLDNIPMGRFVTPDEVAYATLFLASDLSDMITGHILAVDGGWTIK